MALFQRRPSPDENPRAHEGETDAAAEATAPAEAGTEAVPHVPISVTKVGGGAASTAFVHRAPSETGGGAAPGTDDGAEAQRELIPGLADNVPLARALAELDEQPTQPQMLGVIRQLLQGVLYLRVQGDARALLEAGKTVSLQSANVNGQQFVFVFSSAAALRDALLADRNEATSAMGQPALAVLSRIAGGEFDGLVLDPLSAPRRAVLPKQAIVQALADVDGNDAATRLKEIVAGPRTPDTNARAAAALATERIWVAVRPGPASTPENPQYALAEGRTSEGRRYVEVFSHPLEVLVLGRGDSPAPLSPAQLAHTLRSDADIAGITLDPAGPWLRLERPELAELLALPRP